MLVPFSSSVQKTMIKFILLCFCLNVIEQCVAQGTTVSVTEVKAGQLAELPCLSSDDFHRFMFWQLNDGSPHSTRIIGPGNPPDEKKYNYEVLTGKLYIRGVSTSEAGFYKCVSRGIENNSAINMHVVELIVKKDGVVESSFEVNLLWGMTILMLIVVGIAITLFVLLMKRRRMQQSVFDIMEESRENSPAKYVGNMTPAPSSSRAFESAGIDNMGLDVDFPKVLQQIQKEQTLPL